METEKNDPWTQNPRADNSEKWARDVVLKLATNAIKEQRRTRRWGIFFKLITLGYVGVILWMAVGSAQWAKLMGEDAKTHTAIINIEGTISNAEEANASNIIRSLRKAMKAESSAGVILHINSPGGSPVQSGQVYDEIMRLREAHPDKPVYAVAADTCASGAYYIAAAAQEIYADKASIIGSIGVVAGSFGFVDAMQKLGVSRRLFTAGENKALLDPFSPEKPGEAEYFQSLIDEIHQQFITAVKDGRGDRLVDDKQLFTGLFWSGQQSVELGLIDGLGGVRYVAEELVGAEDLVDYTKRQTVIDQLLTQVGVGIGTVLQRTVGMDGLNLR